MENDVENPEGLPVPIGQVLAEMGWGPGGEERRPVEEPAVSRPGNAPVRLGVPVRRRRSAVLSAIRSGLKAIRIL